MRSVVGFAALCLVAACQQPLALSTTEQDSVVVLPAAHDFGTVQVGQVSAAATITVNPAAGVSSSQNVTAVTASCPDFAISAPNLPYLVYRTCSACLVNCVPQLVCTTQDFDSYSFTAEFTPTVAGPLGCVVTIELDGGVTTKTVSLSGTGMAPPVQIAVSPTTVAFGDVRVQTPSSPATVTVSDLGGSTLSVSSATVSAGFSLSGQASFDVAPGGAQALAVTCTPTATGALSGSLVITSNDPGSPLSIPLSCNGVDSNLQITPSPATLPTTLVGAPVTQHITVVNTGGAATSISGVTVDGPGLTLAQPIGNMGLGSGASLGLDVDFDAAAHGPASGTLTIATTEGPRTAQISALALLASLSLSPDGQVDLGPVCAGETASQAFTIVGNGDGPFHVTQLQAPDAPFTATAPNLPAAVAASGGNQIGFTIGVAPAAAGPLASSFAVLTDIPGDAPHTVQVTALGLAAGTSATPTALDLGSTPLETTTIGQPIEITNCSPDALPISGARLTGSDAAEFAIVAQPPESAIAANASATWLVVLTAHTAGLKAAAFEVDTGSATTVVPLTGEGLSPAATGSDAGSERNYYTCSAGGSPASAAAAGAAVLAVLRRRRRRRA